MVFDDLDLIDIEARDFRYGPLRSGFEETDYIHRLLWDVILRSRTDVEEHELVVWNALQLLYPGIQSGGNACEQAQIKGTFKEFLDHCIEAAYANPKLRSAVMVNHQTVTLGAKEKFCYFSSERTQFWDAVCALRNWCWVTQRRPGANPDDALVTTYQWNVLEEKLQNVLPK